MLLKFHERVIEVKFSVITPIYNSYRLMERYFDSLENQTFKDFEVILIDDCSTDDSYQKLKDYLKSSTLRTKVLQTPYNTGPGYARNIGMDIAEGEWITFVDNDDWVELDWLESINQIISSKEVDCVIYDYCIIGEGEPKSMYSMIKGEEGIIPKLQCIKYISNHTIGKVYKLSNCKKSEIKFPNTRRCEDVAFTCLAVEASTTIYYLKKPLYYYYQRKSSLSNNSKLDEMDMVQAFSVLQKKIEKKYPEEMAEKSIRDLLYGGVLMMCKAGKSNKAIKNYISNYENKYPCWYKAFSLSYLGRPKMVFLQFIRYRCIAGLRMLSWIHSKMVG